jgi:hypothetical protein
VLQKEQTPQTGTDNCTRQRVPIPSGVIPIQSTGVFAMRKTLAFLFLLGFLVLCFALDSQYQVAAQSKTNNQTAIDTSIDSHARKMIASGRLSSATTRLVAKLFGATPCNSTKRSQARKTGVSAVG